MLNGAEVDGAVLDGAARSYRQHGFTDVVLIGDHGGYQHLLAAVASGFNREGGKSAARVHFIAAYYDTAQAPYNQLLREHGLSASQIGSM